MRSFGWLAFALLTPSLVAHADVNGRPTPVLTQDSRGAAPIIGGTLATPSQFPTVVAVLLQNGQALCSGTLVDKEWVLTAGHCIVGTAASTTVVMNTTNAGNGTGTQLAVKEQFRNPQFNESNLGSKDIGLIHLAAPVTSVTPSPINFDAAKSPVGSKLTMVGFGATSTNLTGAGREMVLQNKTTSSCASLFGGSDANLLCYSQSDGSGKCEGDSGGPSFMMLNGVNTVVGVTSFGDQNCAQFGADTRTDAEKAFLLQHAPQLEGCKTAQDCMPDVCFNGQCIAAPNTPGGLGSTCTGAAQCDTGQCASGDGGMLCTATCDPNNNICPSGFECLSSGASGLCWPSGDGGGCCDASGQGGATALLGFGFVALVLRRRRR